MKLPIPAPYPLTSNAAPSLYKLEMAAEILSKCFGKPVSKERIVGLVSKLGGVITQEGTVVVSGGMIIVPPPVLPDGSGRISRNDFQKIIDYCIENPDVLDDVVMEEDDQGGLERVCNDINNRQHTTK